MDSVVKVRRSFLNRIRGFCNVFASMCTGCFRSPCSCLLVDEICLAKSLIVEIDNVRDAEEERFYVENPTEEVLARIEMAIRQGGGKLVRSDEIKLEGVSRTSKARHLRTLVLRHRIVRTDIGGKPFYSISEDGLNTNNTNNMTNQGES